MASINVTPLVDVMLVLLVIFMITAPMMLNGIKLELPKTKEVNTLNLNNRQTVLSFSKDGSVFLGKKELKNEVLIRSIKEDFKRNNNDILYLRADFQLIYGKVAALMSRLKKGGITNIALVTEVKNERAK